MASFPPMFVQKLLVAGGGCVEAAAVVVVVTGRFCKRRCLTGGGPKPCPVIVKLATMDDALM